jgi:hypothetical protein
MSDKPTLRPVCITFEPQGPIKFEPLEPNPIFYVGRKLRINGVLCEVCSVEKDGSITVQGIKEVGE